MCEGKVVLDIEMLVQIVYSYKEAGLKVAFISGYFDIVHIGHVSLFKFAKKNCDILIIGVDSDLSIKKSKGDKRPINTKKIRMDFLSHINQIDYIFPLDFDDEFGNEMSYIFWKSLYKRINSSVVVSSPETDKYAEHKRKILHGLKIDFLPFNDIYKTSTTKIMTSLCGQSL